MTDPDDKSFLDHMFGDAASDAASDAAPDNVAPDEVLDDVSQPGRMRSIGLPAAAPGCRELGLTTTGFVIFVSVDSVMMYTPFRISGSTSLLPQAITLLFLAFGLGALLVWSIRGAWRPVGIGMMLGWVFMTLISAGYFTGLNP
jgi:hypothetical protein